MIYKVLKNETIKMIHSKRNYILFGFLIFMIGFIVWGWSVQKYKLINNIIPVKTELDKEMLKMNTVLFLRRFTIEFVFRTNFPYFVFFMVAFSVDIFGKDFFTGNMKYSVYMCENITDFYIGKVASLFVYGLFVVAVNIILAFIISAFAFDITFSGLGRVIVMYLSSIIPVVTFGLIIGLISMFIKNKNISLALGFIISIFLTVSDRLTSSSNFSPVGVLGLMEKIRAPYISLSSLGKCNIVSLIYLVVFLYIGRSILKNKEFNY